MSSQKTNKQLFIGSLVPGIDTTPPVIIGCPSEIIQNLPSGNFASVEWPEPTATDDSGIASLVSQSRRPGYFELNQPVVVTYVFSDPAGNNATCVFTVNVIRE